ncbi:methionyl-tRNA formyltransferase [Algoriphagus sp. NG3]|uniref:methionyl-tRNA formyltransferase n=1 Tax=Algoriphagus sp. NG3 TaxID=3097546 RepID=UPI002A82C2BE|nr:formyltransferase family protein [Algoriphagus sp. NG3]WPR77197.1 formyltransferase family protein [Algoriphagus sp. NG3]
MNRRTEIVVFCAGKSAFPACQLLHLEGYLKGVAVDGQQVETESVLKDILGSQIPLFTISDRRQFGKLEEWLKEIHPSAMFSIGFPYLVPESLLQAYPQKWINFHMGKLPEFRGPMPIFETLKAGEKEAVLTVHLMDKQFDKGNIIWEEEIVIDASETFGSLAVKFSEEIALAAQNTAQMLHFGSFMPSRQQANSSAYCPFPSQRDTTINWAYMNAGEIVDLCRACNPWNGGADTLYGRTPFKVLKAEKIIGKKHQHAAGTVLSKNPVTIGCVDEEVIILQIVSSDYGVESAEDFFSRVNQNQPMLGTEQEARIKQYNVY